MSYFICFDCWTTNKDEALQSIRQQAKAVAIHTGEAQAIYKEANEYKFINASYAYSNGYTVIEILSKYC